MTGPALRRPGAQDPSRARRGTSYTDKKSFYQSEEVAEDYDFHRWGSPERARRNLRKWRAILSALARAGSVGSILDLPCGTGRFTGRLAESGYEVVGSDISLEMMRVARSHIGPISGLYGYVRADAERLPFADGAFDCVMSIRFLFHVDPATRVRIVREMARVSRRWLVLDYRHKYSYRYAIWRLRWTLGLTRTPLARVSSADLRRELAEAGVHIVEIYPIARVFSDKWVVLGEAAGAASP